MLHSLCIAILLSHLARGVPSGIFSNINENVQQEYKLPNVLDVDSYDIDLKTKWDENLKPVSFEGIVKMTIVTKEELDKIVFNSHDLELSNISVTFNEKNIYLKHETDKKYDGYIVNMAEKILPGSKCEMAINFKGNVSTGLTGFYANKYIENGKDVYLATTQFQPNFARRVFPCLDEPHFKSKFKLSITRPANLTNTISNMPIESQETIDDHIKDIFYTTPKMSVYLLYFGLTRFKSSSRTSSIKVWARPRQIKNADYAISIIKKSVAFMENYTDIKYSQKYEDVKMKIDSIAIPNFKFGAMENWGAISYSEDYLVPDMKEISAKKKQRIAKLIAHEIAHQWFGNMVTCIAWDYLWLNEGFAKLFEYLILEKISPEFDILSEMPFQEIQMSFDKDRVGSSQPVSTENLVSQNMIEGRFNFVSYNKAGAILGMIQKTIGTDVFRHGVQTYLKAKMLGNAKPEDLFYELQKAVDEKRALNKYETHNIADIMNTWTKISGYPTVFVSVNYTNGAVILKQKIVGLPSERNQFIFYIPISYTTSYNANFNNTLPSLILTNESSEIQTNLTQHDWIIFNIKQEGYYRVNYDKRNWLNLGNALLKDVNIIHPLNRAQIIDDVFFLAGDLGFDVVFKTIQFLEHDLDVIPWISAAFHFQKIINDCHMAQTVTNFIKMHVKSLMTNFVKNLSLTELNNETHYMTISKNQMLLFSDFVEFDSVKNEAKKIYASFRAENITVNPNIRFYVYCVGMRDGNENDWLFFKELITNETTPTSIKNDLIEALSCFKYNNNNIKYINYLIFEEESLRLSDKKDFLYAMLNHNVESLFKFIESNMMIFKYHEESFYKILLSIPSKLKTIKLEDYEIFIDKYQQILGNNSVNDIKKSINMEINSRKKCIENEEFIIGFLKMKYKNTGNVLEAVPGIIMVSIINYVIVFFYYFV